MRKKIMAAAACLLLLLLLLPPSAIAEDKPIFISIDDELLPYDPAYSVVVSDGVYYVPWYIFPNYGFSISYSYFASASTAYLYSGGQQLFFDMVTGDTFDGNDNHYTVSAIWHNNVVYLPLNLMQYFFGGFTYSISGNEYGSILRISTDAAILSDEEFLQAAKTAMRTYYLASFSSYIPQTVEPVPEPPSPTPAATATPTVIAPTAETPIPSPEPSPAPSPEVAEEPRPLSHAGERIRLALVGLPTERVLNILAQTGIRTCFFLTAEEIRQDPDLVRRIGGEGHSIGIFCGEEDPRGDWEAGNELLFEAARLRTLLVASPSAAAEACLAMAEAEELVYCGSVPEGVEAMGSAALAELAGSQTLLMPCSGGLAQSTTALIRYLYVQQYQVSGPRETD